MSLWRQILVTVEAHRRHPCIQEAVLKAAFLMEKAAIVPHDRGTHDFAGSLGWPEDVRGEPVDLKAQGELIESMKLWATERPSDPTIGAVFWALGKTRDESLIPFFRESLVRQINRSPGAVFQILISLEHLGERPFPRTASRSITEVSTNLEVARRYLAEIGVDLENAD